MHEHDDWSARVQGYLCFGKFLLDHVQILHEDWQVESHITLNESEGIKNVQMPESLPMLMIDFLNDFAHRNFDVVHDQEFDILQDMGWKETAFIQLQAMVVHILEAFFSLKSSLSLIPEEAHIHIAVGDFGYFGLVILIEFLFIPGHVPHVTGKRKENSLSWHIRLIGVPTS